MATTPQTNTDLEAIASFVREHDDFVLCGHVSPDGDCLGSQLALWHTLNAMGKNAHCILVRDEPVELSSSFMPGIECMVAAEHFDKKASVFVGLDVPTRERIEEHACAILDACEHSITIDHHANDATMCEHVYVDPDAASASMLVWELCKLLVDKPPIESALCAFCGLATDTGSFAFQNSDARAFRTASELVDYGVDPAYVAAHAFQCRSLASLKLEQLVIERLRIAAEGEVALSWLTKADFDRFGAVKSDAETLVDTVRSVKGVRIACMLREQDGYVRGSLRAKDDTDVSALAREFGGGGHRAAAGFSLHTGIGEAVKLLESKMSALAESSRKERL